MKYQSVLCVLAGLLPLVTITALSVVVPGFFLFQNYISDLGVSQYALIFSFSLVASGLLIIPFIFLAYKKYSYLIVLFLAAILSLMGVVLFPLTSKFHKPVTALFFLLVLASILTAGTKMTRKWSRWTSITLGILGFAGIAFFNPLTETLLVFAIGLWVAGVGLFSKRLYEK